MIDQDSTEFTEAFVSAMRPGEPRGRPGWWMIMIALGAVFAVALASLLNGALSGTPAAASTWTAVAGPGCVSDGTSFTEVGYYSGAADKAADWSISRTGGYSGAGCTGRFVSVPLSGHARAYDSNRYTLWTFRLSPALEKGAACRLSTYVPDVKVTSAVGGRPAHYYYYLTAYSPGKATPTGAYSVNQVENRGKWVTNGSFSVTGSSQVTVKMVDAGAAHGARAAAAQVRLACSAR